MQVNDTDVGDDIVGLTADALTSEYTYVNQTRGNHIQFFIYLRKQLDRDRVCTRVKCSLPGFEVIKLISCSTQLSTDFAAGI